MGLRWTEEELEAYQRRRGMAGEDIIRPAARATFPIGEGKGGRRNAAPTREPGEGLECPTEDEEQMALFTWAHHMAMMGAYPELLWLFHVPNGGSRGPAEAGRFKVMGVKPGVPDVFLDVPRGGFHGLRIEMKRRGGGRTSAAQREWVEHYNHIGYRAVVCHGWDEARAAIEDYLKGR